MNKIAITILLSFLLVSKGLADVLPINPVPCNITDSLALVDLYNSTNGPGWTNNNNWLHGMVYTWNGVYLSSNGRVNYLYLYSNNLAGTILTTIGNLSGLLDLELSNNELRGLIPSTIGNLTNLIYLDLYGNQLSGSIPSTLGNISTLYSVYLDNNQLTGTLPSSFGNLHNLTILSVSSNLLGGAIPNSIGKLTSFYSLDISYNQFITIPNLSTNTTNESYGGYVGPYANVENNNLSFSTIIPNISHITSYFPQNNVGTTNTVYGTLGKSFTINLGIDSSLTTDTYTWYKNGAYYNTTTVNNISIPKIAITDTGTYSCIITNSLAPNLTLYSNPVRLIIGTGPQITKQPVNISQCAGTKATFSVTATGTGLTYQWYFNGSIVTGATAASYSISNITTANSGFYYVIIIDSKGNKETSTSSILTVNTIPTPTLSPLTPKVCAGTAQVMTATISGGTLPYTSLWTGTGSTELSANNITNPTFQDTTAGTYGLTYKVTDANNCSSSAISTTINNIKVKVSVSSPTVYSFCSGVANRITGSASGGTAPYTYSWTGSGSGYLSNQAIINPLFTGTITGNYTLTFTATDANGCSGSITFPVSVNGNPSASISPLTPKVCAGSSQVMTATVTGGTAPYTSLWTGTGSSAFSATNITNPTFLDTTAGSYGLTYKVTDANNCSSSAVSTTITNIMVKVNISSPTVFSFCSGVANRITGSATGGTAPYTYSWTGSGSGYLSNQAIINPLFTGSTPGNYTLTFTATDANGCSGSITISVTVNGIPAATISPLTPKVCAGSAQVITAPVTGGTSPYTSLWTGTGSSALSATNITNPTFLDTIAGTYGLTYKVTDANNCSSTTVSTTIKNIKVIASISNPTAFIFCQGTSNTITGSVIGGTAPYTYSWTGSGSEYLNKTTTFNPKYTASTLGNYTLTFTATDANGCTGSTTINITVPFAVASNNGPVCKGSTLTLSGEAAGMTSFAWTGPNGFSSTTQSPTVSSSATNAMAGTYTITASNGSCTSTATTTVTINSLPIISAANNGPVTTGNALTLTGAPSGMISYSWTGPFGFTSTAQSPTVSASAASSMAGTYTLIANNGICSNSAKTDVTITTSSIPVLDDEGPICYILNMDDGDVIISEDSIQNSCDGVIYLQLGDSLTYGSITKTTWNLTDIVGNIKIDESTGKLTITGTGSATVTATVNYDYSDTTINTSTQGLCCSDCLDENGQCGDDNGVNFCDCDDNGENCASDQVYCQITTTNISTKSGTATPNFKLIVYPQIVVTISNPPTDDIGLNEDTTLIATVSPSCANTDIKWSSDNEDAIIVVDENTGEIKGVGCGTATLTATSTEDLSAKASCTVTVQPDTGVTINNPPTSDIKRDSTYQLYATVSPSNACDTDVIWTSSNEAIATISTEGIVTGKACGKTIITVKTADKKYSDTCSVNVNIPVTTVTLNQSTATDTLWGTIQLTANVSSDACNKSVKWNTNNNYSTYVESSGLVSCFACGTAKITATAVDGGITDSCIVNVIEPVRGITLNDTVLAISINKPNKQLSVSFIPSSACNQKIYWSSSDTSVATVDTSGIVTTLKLDTAVITATSADTSAGRVYTASCKIIGELRVSLSRNTDTLHVGDTLTLNSTITPSSIANKSVFWYSTKDFIATVDTNGFVTAISGGITYIYAQSNANPNIFDSCKIFVQPQINNITIENIEDPTNTDFIAGRGSIITITGSGFGNTRVIGSKQQGYVSFTNADQGGRLLRDSTGALTRLINDMDTCDYNTTKYGKVWSDSQIQMYLPSIIYSNNMPKVPGKNYTKSQNIGAGRITVTNNSGICDSSNYAINITHSYIMRMGSNLIKYPMLLKNGLLSFTYGTGLLSLDSRGMSLIKRAMKEWSCRLNISISLDSSTLVNDIIYLKPDTVNPHALMSTYNPSGGSFIGKYYYPGSTIININKNQINNFDFSYPDNPVINYDFYHAILHELGHSLALDHMNDSIPPNSLMYWADYKSAAWNGRQDLRDQQGQPENPADLTNSVKDANFIVTKSEQMGMLTQLTPNNCSPVAPLNLSDTAVSAGEIILKWKAASDMDYYSLTRTDEFGNKVLLYWPGGAPIGAGTSSYQDPTVSQNSIYTYTLTSINSFGKDNSSTRSISTPLLSKPGIIQTTATKSNNVTISWSGNATTYTLLRTSNTGQTETIFTKLSITSYADTTVAQGVTYTYQVEGYISNDSILSAPVTVTTCLCLIQNTNYSSSTVIYPCNNTIELINDTIMNNSNVQINGSSNKVNIQGKFQVQKGSSFYAK